MSTLNTLTDQARILPRTAIGATLGAARLPLSAAQRIRGQQGNAEWAPTMAFEGAEARVETILGALLHDPELERRGRLRDAKLTKLREAVQLSTLAEQQQETAARRYQDRHDADEQRREQVTRDAQRRAKQAEQQTSTRKARVEKATAARKQTARKQQIATDKQVERHESSAKLAAVEAETEALAAKRDAVAATDTAAVVDEQLDLVKETRKAQ